MKAQNILHSFNICEDFYLINDKAFFYKELILLENCVKIGIWSNILIIHFVTWFYKFFPDTIYLKIIIFYSELLNISGGWYKHGGLSVSKN